MRFPSPPTLAKYGLTEADYARLWEKCEGRCPVCHRTEEEDGIRLVIDHQHVAGFKRMPPHERARWVRGLVCDWCNSQFLRHSIDAGTAHELWVYLAAFEARRPPLPERKRQPVKWRTLKQLKAFAYSRGVPKGTDWLWDVAVKYRRRKEGETELVYRPRIGTWPEFVVAERKRANNPITPEALVASIFGGA